MSGIRNLKLEVILQAVDKATRPLKAVMRSGKGVAHELQEMRNRFKDLNRAQAQINEFRNVSRGAAVTANQLNAAQERVRQLKDAMAGTLTPAREMTRALKDAQREASTLKMRHSKLIERQQRLRTSLNEAGYSTTGLAAKQRELKSQLQEVSGALKQQEERLLRVNKQQQRMHAARAQYDKGMEVRNKMAGTGAGMSAAGAAAGAAVLVPVRNYAEAEDAATQLKVSMMRKGGEVSSEFDRINELANRLGNRLPGTTADFQNMMTMLIRQGMSAQTILGGLGEATGYLAVQLKMPFELAAEFSAQLQDATRSTEKDMMGLMDVIQRTYYTGVNPDWMLQGFSKLSAGMDTINQKGLDGAKALAPLLAMANQAGMTDGGSAGNSYRKVFQKSMDTANIQGILKDLKTTQGIELDLSFTNGKGEFGGLPQMFEQLNKLKGLSTETRLQLIKDLYGDDAEVTQVVSLLITKGQAGYDEMLGKMNAQASLQERVNTQLGTLKNLWDAAIGTFTNALVRFGEAIAPELKALTQWIGEVSEKVGNWAKENPALANTLMKVAGITAIVLTVLGGLTLALAAVFGPMLIARAGLAMFAAQLGGGARLLSLFTGGFGLMKSALALASGGVMKLIGILRLLFVAMMANPILAIIALIAGAAVYIWANWDTLGPKFMALWGKIKAGAGAAWDWVKAKAVAVGQALLAFFMNWTLPGLLFSHWDSIKAGAGAAWDWVKAKAIGVGHALLSFFMNWTLPGLIYGHWDGIMAWMGQLPGRFATLGAQIMQGLVSGITNGLGAVKDAITGAGGAAIDWFKEKLGIHSPSRVFAELGGFTMAGLNQGLADSQNGPLATVMNFAKQLTAVGAGIALGAGTAVAGNVPIDNRPPISAAAPASSSAPAAPNIFQIYAAPGMDEQQLAKLVAAEVAKLERQKAARGRSRLGDRD